MAGEPPAQKAGGRTSDAPQVSQTHHSTYQSERGTQKVHMNLHFSEARQGNKPEGPLFYFQGKKAAQAGCTIIPIPSLNPFLHFFSDQLVSKHPQTFYLFKIILFVLCTYMYVW